MIKIKRNTALFKFVTPLIFFSVLTVIFFKDYFFKGYIPIPGDIIIGTYYPWLNQKWDHIVGVAVKNPPMSDVVSLMYPWRLTAINYFKNFQFPLWDPTQFMGISLIGNFQAAIFNPFNILFMLPLRFNLVWGFQVAIQPFIGLISMYLLMRSWKFSKLTAYFASISYAFSAQMVVWCEYNLLGFSIAVFPLFFYLINLFFENKKNLFLYFFSLATAFIIFVGYPQLVYYILFFSFLYFVYLIFREKSVFKDKILLFIKFIISIFLGLSLAAIQLLPGYEMTINSVRDLDTVAWQNKSVFLPYGNLITAFSPDFFGNPATYNYWGTGSYESFVFYTSLVALILAVFSFQSKKRHILRIFILGMLMLMFFFVLENPLSNYFQSIGFLGLKGSVHARILFIYGFCISVLAGIGLERIIGEGKITKKIFSTFLIPAALTGIMLGILLIYKLLPENISGHLNVSFRNTIFPLGISFLSATTILLFLRTRKIFFIVILFLLLIVDTFRFGYKYLPFTPEDEIFPKTPTTDFLEMSDEPFRIGIEKAELLTANTWSVFNLQSPSGYNILVSKDTLQFLSYLNSKKPDTENKRFVEIINFDSKLLDLINTKYTVSLLREKDKPDPNGSLPQNMQTLKFQPVFKENSVLIMQNMNALPRFFTVNKYLAMDSDLGALNYMISDKFVPGDEVVLDKNPGLNNLSKCNLSLLKYTGQSYLIQSQCQRDSILVLTESFDSGWKAKINNAEVITYKADANFIAVPLKAGDSVVEIYYLPQSLITGAIISGFSVLLVLVFLILEISIFSTKNQKKYRQ